MHSAASYGPAASPGNTVAPPPDIRLAVPAGTREAIDAAIRRGAMAGLLAMRAADPSVRLPDAADLLVFRRNAGVTGGTTGR
ncbi:hypothetical protein [Dactylosporangium sp. NPDC005555]|uniref:hypothetical protein n=1 Tax=Dactylosporangium sp. NPDC005555 TaxID=3154889 RepID=UPI00339DEF09